MCVCYVFFRRPKWRLVFVVDWLELAMARKAILFKSILKTNIPITRFIGHLKSSGRMLKLDSIRFQFLNAVKDVIARR